MWALLNSMKWHNCWQIALYFSSPHQHIEQCLNKQLHTFQCMYIPKLIMVYLQGAALCVHGGGVCCNYINMECSPSFLLPWFFPKGMKLIIFIIISYKLFCVSHFACGKILVIFHNISTFSHRFSFSFLDLLNFLSLLPDTLMFPQMLKSWESIPPSVSILCTFILSVSLSSLLSSICLWLSSDVGASLTSASYEALIFLKILLFSSIRSYSVVAISIILLTLPMYSRLIWTVLFMLLNVV